MGERQGYFGQVVKAGSHLRALKMLLERRIDALAIDSTVLEFELQARPGLQERLRVIEIFGPSPIPPWVVNKRVPADLRAAIQSALCQMHEDPEGQAILAEGQIARLVEVVDRDYDDIREMARLAEQVSW